MENENSQAGEMRIQYHDEPVRGARIKVIGVGGGGGNAVNRMIQARMEGVEFIAANTDVQALKLSQAPVKLQLGVRLTQGLGAGANPDVGRRAALEDSEKIIEALEGADMVFVTAGLGGGTGTGAAPVIARVAREMGILTVGVVTKPFHFEGGRRMRLAESGIAELHRSVDTLIIIPNQNLFRVANEKTTFADAFAMADQVLYSGVACITDLMVKEGLINLDFADVRSIMSEMGKAMMGTGEATRARSSPDASPVPIIALPISVITVRTSAKSRLIRPGSTIRSVIERTPECSTWSAMAKASVKVVRSLAMRNRFWFGMTIRVST